MMLKTEVLIIGAGPGGYVAAIRLGRLGKQVVLVEKDGLEGLGGICMNHGCIPSKALITASRFFDDMKNAGDMGITVSGLSVDPAKLQDWKNGILKKLRSGVDFLLKKNNVRWIKGEAHFESSNSVRINGNPEIDSVEFDHAIIATGAVPNSLQGLDFDGKSVISYNEALDLREIPKDFLVVGGGYIGVEMAACYARMGSNVKLVHRGERILKENDEDVVNVVQKKMQKGGVDFVFNANVMGVERVGERLKAKISSKERGEFDIEVDKILVAVGVSPNSKNIGLGNTKVAVDGSGSISVDKKLRTADPSIFAIGDVATKPLLAHKASREARLVADTIVGKERVFDNACVPYVIFSDPEIAVAGITESEARQKGIEINVGKFPFSALGRAVVEGETEGFVKVVEDKNSGKVLGIAIVGSAASSLVGEAALAVENGLKTEDIMKTIHPHPTFPESMLEAAEAVRKMAVHIVEFKA